MQEGAAGSQAVWDAKWRGRLNSATTLNPRSKLSEHFLALARDLDVMEPKVPEDVYKSHLIGAYRWFCIGGAWGCMFFIATKHDGCQGARGRTNA